MALSDEIEDLFKPVHDREEEIFRLAKDKPSEAGTQESLKGYRGALATLSINLDTVKDEAQYLMLQEVELNK